MNALSRLVSRPVECFSLHLNLANSDWRSNGPRVAQIARRLLLEALLGLVFPTSFEGRKDTEPFTDRAGITFRPYTFFNSTNCAADSISSVAETRDRALNSFQGSGVYELAYCCLLHQWRFKCDTWRNQTDSPCAASPHA